MALPTLAVLNTAFDSIFAALNTDPTRGGSRAAVRTLCELAAPLASIYKPAVTLTVTDTTDASLAVAFVTTGQLRVAFGRAVELHDIFQVAGTGDVTDNALGTAKGSAVAAADIFVVTNKVTPAVAYLGNVTSAPLDFSAETGDLFVWPV